MISTFAGILILVIFDLWNVFSESFFRHEFGSKTTSPRDDVSMKHPLSDAIFYNLLLLPGKNDR